MTMPNNESSSSRPALNVSSELRLLANPDSKYETIAVIGNGAYGTVYKARNYEDGKIVALKVVKPQENEDGLSLSTLREISFLKQIDNYEHPNVVRLFDVFPKRESQREFTLTIVFEFIDQDLSTYLEKCPPPGLDVYRIQDLMQQMIKGLDFLHSHRIVHRDLKPQNILVTRDGKLKLADFGLARIFGTDMALTSVVVTLWYRAPEVLLQDSYGRSVDLWSCGCIMAELYRKKALFRGESEIDQLRKIFDIMGTPSAAEWPENCGVSKSSFRPMPKRPLELFVPELDNDSKDLLEKFLTFDPEQRLTTSQALSHPFLASGEAFSEEEDAVDDYSSDDGFTEEDDEDDDRSVDDNDGDDDKALNNSAMENKSVIENADSFDNKENLNTPKLNFNRGT
ncbi:cyclin-dependent kinase 4-like [Tubulanus polymorphus]|uniref:cyclin-dependent kinase 4-like n=1 Tax=Tubulanus polymorphus TaxID=672921 RepID=UPI003DA40159